MNDFVCNYAIARFRPYWETQEIIMRRRLGEYLQKVNLARFYRQDFRVGDDSYNVILPFVHIEGNTPRKVINPLHLDKPSSNDIYPRKGTPDENPSFPSFASVQLPFLDLSPR